MADPIYPASDLDQRDQLAAVLGSFWSGTYQGRDLVASLLYARAQLAQQSFQDLQELTASMSRLRVPVWHTRTWYPLTLRESLLNQGQANLANFDGVYSFDGTLAFDVPMPSATYFVWDLPQGLHDCLTIQDRITGAQIIWTKSTDYFLSNGGLWLRSNPFSDERFLPRPVLADGAVVDRELDLWLYQSQWDRDTLYQQFGYVLGAPLPSAESYKRFINAHYDGLVQGTTVGCLQELIAAACDVPLAQSNETVVTTFDDGTQQWVVTDQHAYACNRNATLTAQVGDELIPGDSLSDAVQFFEFNRGQVPAAIRALAVGKGLLAAGYFQDLVFENKTVPLEVSTDDAGYTRVSFTVGGFPTDVEKFWDDVHAAGVASGQTLAMLLDPRTNPTGQPSALVLPATINPLGFLLQNVFRNNLFVVKIRPAATGPNALGLACLTALRRLVPPQAVCVLLVEWNYQEDAVVMDGAGDTERPGYTESQTFFPCNQQSEQIDPANYVSERVRFYQVSGQCI